MVGTHADNDVVLTDATVSRYHLEVRVRREGIEIRDLETTNGTKHGGARVGQVVLTGAARLRLGKHTEIDVEPIDASVELGEWAADRFGDVLGVTRADEAAVRAAGEGRADRGDDPAPGRDRHRQGGDRRGGPPGQPALEGPVRRRRLRLDPARADRVGAVRPRQRQLHRCGRRQAGPDRGCEPRHAVPRRDRRARARSPAAAPARARSPPGPARRRDAVGRRRHPRDRRDAPRPARDGPRRPVPRRPVLPARRRRDVGPAAARPQGRHPRTRDVVRREDGPRHVRAVARAARPAPASRLAGQRARAT